MEQKEDTLAKLCHLLWSLALLGILLSCSPSIVDKGAPRAGADTAKRLEWTVDLSRTMLRKHPNLFMSLRMGGGVPYNRVLDERGGIKPEWLGLFRDFPDRFVIGSDQFFVSPDIRGSAPGTVCGHRAQRIRAASKTVLSRLPPDFRRKIGYENAVRLYKLKEWR